MSGSVLVVDDDVGMCELLETDLRLRGYEAASSTSAASALQYLNMHSVDVVVSDVRMPGTSGLELCAQVAASHPGLPVIVMTAFGSMETAVAALRAGAYDFITKPLEMDLLTVSLDRAIAHQRLQQQVRRLTETVDHASHFGEILGNSPAMLAIYQQLAQIAPANSSVLLTGESGTGKELVARWIHRRGPRNTGPFVAVNCAALPEPLLESELFGHAKGAFTDARVERKGLFLQADGGTLFLDEVGELPLSMQVKLLRVLEQRTVRPVGGDREIPINVRLLSATNRDLEEALEANQFREDLFYRINVIQVELPPLRARGSDVLTIAQHFLQEFANLMSKPIGGIRPEAAERLLAYNWPGNVRELRNVMERAVALARTDRIDIADLPDKVRQFRKGRVLIDGDDPLELVRLEELERRYIQHVLDVAGGNRSQAARILGLDRKTLYRKLREVEPD
ncbi:MAG: sigma-54 dependent transcriptional regulator [Planctomycetota bacterium]|nr:sigma-54 dependent transcriptional regulator [Planctomycetota bacterium]MDA1178394.1 sigma-54 dependent transcriptional regulator [Planctomycetota bacterium]